MPAPSSTRQDGRSLSRARRLRYFQRIAPGGVRQKGIRPRLEQQGANCRLVLGRGEHQRRHPVAVSGVQIVSPSDVHAHGGLHAGKDCHLQETVEEPLLLDRDGVKVLNPLAEESAVDCEFVNDRCSGMAEV